MCAIKKNYDNIINYGNEKDSIFTSNIDNQPGKTYVITDNYDPDANELATTYMPNSLADPRTHKLENMGDISKSTEYKGEKTIDKGNMIFKLSIEKTVDWKYLDPERIITLEEIERMSNEEFLRNEDIIYQKSKEGKVMSEAEARKKNGSKTNKNSSSGSNGNGSDNGHWVTINGNHVLIED